MQLIALSHYTTNKIRLHAVPYEAEEGAEFEYIETYSPRELFTLPQFMQKALIVVDGIEVSLDGQLNVFVTYHEGE